MLIVIGVMTIGSIIVASKYIRNGYKNVKNAIFGDPLETYYNLQIKAIGLEDNIIKNTQKSYQEILNSAGMEQFKSFSKQIYDVDNKIQKIQSHYTFGQRGAQSLQYYILENKKDFLEKSRIHFNLAKSLQEIILRDKAIHKTITKMETYDKNSFDSVKYIDLFLKNYNTDNINIHNKIKEAFKKAKSKKESLLLVSRHILSADIKMQTQIYSKMFKENNKFSDLYQLSSDYAKTKDNIVKEEKRLKVAGHIK